MNFQTWLDSKRPFYERLLGAAGLFVVQNILEEAYEAGRLDEQTHHRPVVPDKSPLSFDWEKTMYPKDENTGCAVDAFMRNNPNYQGALGLYCSCPKCSAYC